MPQRIIETSHKLGDITSDVARIASDYLTRFPSSKAQHAIAFAMLKARQ